MVAYTVTSAPRRLRQEDWAFEDGLGYTGRLCLNTNQKENFYF